MDLSILVEETLQGTAYVAELTVERERYTVRERQFIPFVSSILDTLEQHHDSRLLETVRYDAGLREGTVERDLLERVLRPYRWG